MSCVIRCVLLAIGLLVSPVFANAHEPESSRLDSRAVGAIMPRLSPGGEAVAFSYQGAIWRMERAGEMTRLTRAGGFDVEPAWSPDGTTNRFDYRPSLWQRNARGDRCPRRVRKSNCRASWRSLDKLHFDRAGRRVLGLFQPPSEKIRLAWFDLAIWRIDHARSLPSRGRGIRPAHRGSRGSGLPSRTTMPGWP